jgi:hypothetical protein
VPLYTLKAASVPATGRQVTALTPSAGTVAGCLSDGADTTYDRELTPNLPADVAVGAWPTLAAGERIVSVAPYVRYKTPGSGFTVALGAVTTKPSIAEGASLVLPGGVAAATTAQIAVQLAQLLNPDPAAAGNGGEWTTGGGYTPSLTFRDPNGAAGAAYLYEAGAYVYTLKAATIAAPSAPSGTVTTTQEPTITATVSQIVESWQLISDGSEFFTTGIVEMSIYRYADVGAATSPPAGAVPVWGPVYVPYTMDTYIDGVTPSTKAVSFAPTNPLSNDTYVAYVRVSRDHPTWRPVFSGYQRCSWTQNAALPTIPYLGTLQASDALQAVQLGAHFNSNGGFDSTTAQVDVQRKVGSVWRAVRGITGLVIPCDGGQQALPNDLECDRGVTNYYRIRGSQVNTTDGLRYYTAWNGPYPVAGPALQGTCWNVKAVNAPASSWLSAGILLEPQEADQTQSTVFYPLDRDLPVVVKGSAGGWSGSYDFIANGAAAVAAVRALTDYEGLVLVETAFGDTFYCSLTGVAIKRQGTSAAPRLAGTLTFTQVDCDLATVSS